MRSGTLNGGTGDPDALTVLTLASCDTCRRARAWLNERMIAHEVHDVRAEGLDRETVARIIAAVGVEQAVNKRSTTWRGLSDAQRERLDEDHAVALILEHPTLLKRPVFLTDPPVVGFNEATRERLAAPNALNALVGE